MGQEEQLGYVGWLARELEQIGAKVGDEVEVVRPDGRRYVGRLMSRYEVSSEDFITLKLRNGYNVGVRVPEGSTIRKLGTGMPPAFRRPPLPPQDPTLPRVSVLSTGGTIASRIDYYTGAVRPALSSEDLVSLVPEISSIANVESEVLFSVFSEDMTPEVWDALAYRLNDLIRKEGVDGIVVTHGTDTMHYTAAALSFVLQRPPVPIVLVGAQRSSDRPSSDAYLNLAAAITIAAKAPFGEVVVAMHDTTSDTSIGIHRGTRVKKLHTSSRDAFKTINGEPIARYENGKVEIIGEVLNRRGSDGYSFHPGFSDSAVLIKFYPSMPPDVLEYYASRGVRGIIIEGTGLGHVSSRWIPTIRKLVRDGIFVGMTSQCIYGRVNMNVYSNGRYLLSAGVCPLGDMLSEVALVKLMWVLKRTDSPEEVIELMQRPLAGELSERTAPYGSV